MDSGRAFLHPAAENTATDGNPTHEPGTRRSIAVWGQWAVAAVALFGLFLAASALPLDQIVRAVSTGVEGLGIWGPVVFAGIYAIASVLLVPGSALTIAAGAIFGIVWGTVTVSLASTAAAAIAFLLARYVARDAIARRLGRHPKFRAVDRAVGQGGWKVVVLLRLSPAVPFTLLNYLLGLTAIRYSTSVLASWISMLPGTLLYVYLGHVGRAGIEAAASGQDSGGTSRLVVLVAGLVATVVVTVYITKLARKALREEALSEEKIVDSGTTTGTRAAAPRTTAVDCSRP